MNTFTNKLDNNFSINNNKERFLDLIADNIARDIDLSFFNSSDFFKAPCSTKYHLAVDGGLCQHSLNVYDALYNLCVLHDINVQQNLETITIVALFHDLCKANFYKRNISNYVNAPKYTCEDAFPIGHGEKSVMICLTDLKLKLTQEEMLAIRWHMGAWDDSVKSNPLALNNAQTSTKLVTLLHLADMYATHIIERGT